MPLTDAGANFAGMILPLSREQVAAAHNGGGNGTVTVGFRPEDTDLVTETEGGMPILVDLVEELGSDAYAYGTLHAGQGAGGGDKLMTIRVDAKRPPLKGDTIHIQVAPDEVHVFSAESGRRVSGDVQVSAVLLLQRSDRIRHVRRQKTRVIPRQRRLQRRRGDVLGQPVQRLRDGRLLR